MKIVFSAFKGTAPKYDEEQLTDGYAEQSINTRPGREILEPWRESELIDTLANPPGIKSLFKYRNEWFSWTDDVYAVRAPLKNDPYEYVLIAQKGQDPRVTTNLQAESGSGPYPSSSIILNVPIPPTPVIQTVGDSDNWFEGEGGDIPDPAPEDSEFDNYSVSYAFVYRDAWGRLSALSEPSESVDIREYEFVTTTKVTLLIPSAPAELLLTDATRGTSASILIYRTNSSSTGTGVFQFVDEIPITETTYVDQKYSGDLLEAPINEEWTGAPDTDTSLFPNGSVEKFVIMGADIIVGHNEKLLVFAEPEVFYAFPVEYFLAFTEKIVTISPSGSNLVVLTDSFPYIVQGAHPSSMDAVKLSDPIPCSNPKAVTEVDGSVYFASSTGLFKIDGYNVTNVIRAYVTEQEWAALGPTTMQLANYDGLVFIYSAATESTYVFSTYDPMDGLRQLDLEIDAFAQMDNTNDLAYVEKGTSNLMKFDSHISDFRELSWISKTYDLNVPVCFCVMKVKANQYPVSVTITATKLDGSGEYTTTRTVNNADFVYLPFENRSKRWKVSVTAPNPQAVLQIRSIQIGETPSEFE